jgi:hypothetical protein
LDYDASIFPIRSIAENFQDIRTSTPFLTFESDGHSINFSHPVFEYVCISRLLSPMYANPSTDGASKYVQGFDRSQPQLPTESVDSLVPLTPSAAIDLGFTGEYTAITLSLPPLSEPHRLPVFRECLTHPGHAHVIRATDISKMMVASLVSVNFNLTFSRANGLVAGVNDIFII